MCSAIGSRAGASIRSVSVVGAPSVSAMAALESDVANAEHGLFSQSIQATRSIGRAPELRRDPQLLSGLYGEVADPHEMVPASLQSVQRNVLAWRALEHRTVKPFGVSL